MTHNSDPGYTDYAVLQDKNQELLRSSELGVLLDRAYIAALNYDPRLEEVAIVPMTDPEVPSHAFARPRWSKDNQTGHHEIHIRLDDLDGTLDFFEKTTQ